MRAYLATMLLGCVLPRRDVEAIIGDLEEEADSAGWFCVQVVRSIPALLWLTVYRSGGGATFGLAVVICAIQMAIEVATGFAVYELAPADALWPAIAALVVTMASLTFLSYRATRIRTGAAAALAGVATCLIGLRLLLVLQAGQGIHPGTLAALLTSPAAIFTGGFLSFRSQRV